MRRRSRGHLVAGTLIALGAVPVAGVWLAQSPQPAARPKVASLRQVVRVEGKSAIDTSRRLLATTTAPALATTHSTPRPLTVSRHTTTARAKPTLSAPTNTSLLTPAPVPRGAEPIVQIGAIRIDAIGLNQPLFEGVAQNVIDAGPAHWTGTARPGGLGNVVVAGHRTTHTHPFYAVANLHNGDRIVFTMRDGWSYVYAVSQEFVVPNSAMWITNQQARHTVTLFTCHPIGGSAKRLIVRGNLVATIAP